MDQDFFDFNQVSEEKDDLDYDHLLDCPHCKKPIPQDAILCYYCGKEVYFEKKSNWFFWLIVILVILLIGYFIL